MMHCTLTIIFLYYSWFIHLTPASSPINSISYILLHVFSFIPLDLCIVQIGYNYFYPILLLFLYIYCIISCHVFHTKYLIVCISFTSLDASHFIDLTWYSTLYTYLYMHLFLSWAFFLVWVALCRRCRNSRRPLFWSERCCADGVETAVGHYFWYYFTLVVLVLVLVGTRIPFTPEGIVIGFQIFAWAPN